MSGPQQMAPDPKKILHQAVGRGEALELPDRLEAAQLSWVSSSTVSRRQGRHVEPGRSTGPKHARERRAVVPTVARPPEIVMPA